MNPMLLAVLGGFSSVSLDLMSVHKRKRCLNQAGVKQIAMPQFYGLYSAYSNSNACSSALSKSGSFSAIGPILL